MVYIWSGEKQCLANKFKTTSSDVMCSTNLPCRSFYLLTILILPHSRHLVGYCFLYHIFIVLTINLFAITFVERANQDAKPEIGWDEFQALRYRAWDHHRLLPPWLHASSLKLKPQWMSDSPCPKFTSTIASWCLTKPPDIQYSSALTSSDGFTQSSAEKTAK